MADRRAVPERLSGVAAGWAIAAANQVPSLPVRPEVTASFEAHVLSTICVELVQPLTGLAARWTEGCSTAVLGRVEVKLRHLEAIGKKVGRDLGLEPLTVETRALLEDLKVRSTAPKREGGAPAAWFASCVDQDEALVARQVLLSLAEALRQGSGGSSRKAGSEGYRFRDGPAIVSFWSMKVETCSPGVTQRLPLRLARRSPREAIADAAAELLARLQGEPADVVGTERHVHLIELCERTLADLAPPG
jgi:hypothetical protein